MDTTKICSGCQEPLAPDAPDGLCPACLMRAGLGTGVDIGSDSEAEGARTRFVAPTPEELVKPFPELEILGFIGQGGMGAVYRVRQKALDRVVALKILPPGIGGDPSFAQRFTREAQALAKLNHPGIVTLYEFGQADALFYFLMEFVDGVNLRHLLEAGRVSPREALDLCPLRILEPMNQAILDVARQNHTPLVDVRRLFEGLTDSGIPGGYRLLDHVHPSIPGHQLIANALADEMARLGFVHPVPDWKPRRDRRFQEHFDSLDDFYFSKGEERLDRVQRWTQGQATRTRRSRGRGPPADRPRRDQGSPSNRQGPTEE